MWENADQNNSKYARFLRSEFNTGHSKLNTLLPSKIVRFFDLQIYWKETIDILSIFATK